MPSGATVYEARNIVDFQHLAARHAINWYRYMFSKGRGDPNGSLYLVTECTKSINWGTAVFYPHPTTSDYLRLTFDQESCQWDCQGKVDARTGPKAKDIIGSNDEPNQCVFLRGYKIMLRQDVWDKLKKAQVVPLTRCILLSYSVRYIKSVKVDRYVRESLQWSIIIMFTVLAQWIWKKI